MTATFTRGADSFSPTLRLKQPKIANESQTTRHKIIDGSIWFTLLPDAPRAGSMDLLFADETTAEAARLLLIQVGPWVLVDSENPSLSMTLVRDGDLAPAQQESLTQWVLELGFAEVPA